MITDASSANLLAPALPPAPVASPGLGALPRFSMNVAFYQKESIECHIHWFRAVYGLFSYAAFGRIARSSTRLRVSRCRAAAASRSHRRDRVHIFPGSWEWVHAVTIARGRGGA